MIFVYHKKNDKFILSDSEMNEDNMKSALWIDLLNPTKEEEKIVEKIINVEVPTREEMHEIELSSRLYQEGSSHFMTAVVVTNANTKNPESHAITFILQPERLVTLRYSEPSSFNVFVNRLEKNQYYADNSGSLFIGLAECIVDRAADVLEKIGRDIDSVANKIFSKSKKKKKKNPNQNLKPALGKVEEEHSKVDYQKMLQKIGRIGDLISQSRESLMTLSRMASFASQNHVCTFGENRSHISSLAKDIAALNDHASFMGNKVNFLLDATLGMISIEQNNIIKIFSVAAVVFLPPTLIASIYGMNFHVIPELDLSYGYPMALIMMIMAAYLPYKFFKKKKWL